MAAAADVFGDVDAGLFHGEHSAGGVGAGGAAEISAAFAGGAAEVGDCFLRGERSCVRGVLPGDSSHHLMERERASLAHGPAEAPGAAEDRTAMLVEYLGDHDAECPLCGYNLRGLTEPRCPECGKGIGFTVTLAEPYLRAWVALAAASFCSAGVGLFFALLMTPRGALPVGEAERALLMAMLSWFWANIPLAGVVLWLRRPFLRLGRAAQRTLAVAAWLISVAAFLVVAGILF
jgi:hypothetical protein